MPSKTLPYYHRQTISPHSASFFTAGKTSNSSSQNPRQDKTTDSFDGDQASIPLCVPHSGDDTVPFFAFFKVPELSLACAASPLPPPVNEPPSSPGLGFLAGLCRLPFKGEIPPIESLPGLPRPPPLPTSPATALPCLPHWPVPPFLERGNFPPLSPSLGFLARLPCPPLSPPPYLGFLAGLCRLSSTPPS
eukprot:356604-Chlamydomonas_euryale.AAC.6